MHVRFRYLPDSRQQRVQQWRICDCTHIIWNLQTRVNIVKRYTICYDWLINKTRLSRDRLWIDAVRMITGCRWHGYLHPAPRCPGGTLQGHRCQENVLFICNDPPRSLLMSANWIQKTKNTCQPVAGVFTWYTCVNNKPTLFCTLATLTLGRKKT